MRNQQYGSSAPNGAHDGQEKLLFGRLGKGEGGFVFKNAFI
jgi:hypothetical protein